MLSKHGNQPEPSNFVSVVLELSPQGRAESPTLPQLSLCEVFHEGLLFDEGVFLVHFAVRLPRQPGQLNLCRLFQRFVLGSTEVGKQYEGGSLERKTIEGQHALPTHYCRRQSEPALSHSPIDSVGGCSVCPSTCR